MFAIIERKLEWIEKDIWSDPCCLVEERILDVGEKDMLKKYNDDDNNCNYIFSVH